MNVVVRWPQGPGYFSAEEEALYMARQNERAVSGARVLLLSSAVAIMIFGFWDYFIMPTALPRTLPIRAIGASIAVFLWAIVAHPRVRQRVSWILFINSIIGTSVIAWVLIRLPDGIFYGLPGLFFIPLGLPFHPNHRTAASTSIAILVTANLVLLASPASIRAVTNTNVFLAAMCAIACLMAWLDEARNRRTFLLERNLERLATMDELSGAYNRRHFTHCAEVEIDRARRYGHDVAVLLLDIDHFKRINDTWGHHTGDNAIRVFSQTCIDTLRSSDFLGRMGGEEFAILLPETDGPAAYTIAERLRESLAHVTVANTEPGGTFSFTASIGVAEWEGENDTLSSLLQRADDALYAAKRNGRNRVECKNGNS